MSNKKNIILVAVRLSSNRLKNKALLNLYDSPLILKLTERIKKSKFSSDIIWCTSTNKDDDKLEEIALVNNINIYRGSELDVMSRFIYVSEKYNADNIVRVTGDNPLTDPEIIDFLIDKHVNNNLEYTYCSSTPIGTRSEVISSKMLKKCHNLLIDKYSSEYMTWMLNRPDHFKVGSFIYPNKKLNRPEISFSVDENEDYEAVNTIFKYYKNTIPSLENIIDFVDKNPILLSKLINKKNKKKIDKINVKFKTDL